MIVIQDRKKVYLFTVELNYEELCKIRDLSMNEETSPEKRLKKIIEEHL